MAKTTSPLRGYHHITICAGDAREDYDFHVRVLGLRCIKKTVLLDGDDPIYHLYYGNGLGEEGTLLTAFAMPHRAPGRAGSGQIASVGLSVPQGSLGYWEYRFRALGVHTHSLERFGEQRLAVRHPAGIEYELVPVANAPAQPWGGGDVPAEAAIRGVYAIRVSSRELREMTEFMTGALDLAYAGREGSDSLFAMGDGGPGRLVEITHEPDRPQGSWGYARNTINHVAFNVRDDRTQAEIKAHLEGLGYIDAAGPVHRNYFYSVYFRTPSGAMFEATYTDGQGFLKDETFETLGTTFQLPPWLVDKREELLARLGPVND